MPAKPEEPLVEDFKRRVDFLFNRDRIVRRHRRKIFKLHEKISATWGKIAEVNKLIRLRHKVIAFEAAESVKRRLSNYRPSANQIYPRKVFRHTPPP